MNQDKEHRHADLRMIPLNRIEVLNPRERNSRVFEQIVGNIQSIGLKKPLTGAPTWQTRGAIGCGTGHQLQG
jgi:ParB family transcriptional regulator, chromosome partitioning protein